MTEKEKLMVKVSKMYYDYGISQKDIAMELGLSRGYVCQLMEQARNAGIVEIKVNDMLAGETELERHVREAFQLEQAKIVFTPQHIDVKVLTVSLVNEACKYLDAIIESGMTVGFSWGWTIYQVSSNMMKHACIRNVTAIPLCGGTTDLEKKIYVSEISRNIAEAYNGAPLFIPLPAILQSNEIKEAICRDTNIGSLFEKMRTTDIALFTVGSFGEENILYRGGYINDASMKRLIQKNAVGDLVAHFINEHGEICDDELDDRTVSIELEQFSKIKKKVCIATGTQKVRALLGVLRKGYVDVLITDENTIRNVLKRM